jgi:PEP-CTERM motif-containing protein
MHMQGALFGGGQSMKMRILSGALAAAAALSIATPASATVPIDYTFSGDVTGTLELNFDSSQPFSSAYTLSSYSLTTNGVTFTPTDLSLSFYTGSLYALAGGNLQGTLLIDCDPALTSQTAELGTFQPFIGDPPRPGDPVGLDNITITQAVPEPATWAMMLLGFGAIGFAMRRRKPAQALVG